MDHADRVRGLERERDLVRDVERAVQLDRAFLLDQVLERLALEVLHHEVDRAVGRMPKSVTSTMFGWLIDGRRARLAQEAMDRLLVARELRVQHLHRDRLLDVDVLAAVDGAHAAAAEDLVEPVVADRRAEPRDVLFLDEDRRVVEAEPLPVGEPREAARTDFHALVPRLHEQAEEAVVDRALRIGRLDVEQRELEADVELAGSARTRRGR